MHVCRRASYLGVGIVGCRAVVSQKAKQAVHSQSRKGMYVCMYVCMCAYVDTYSKYNPYEYYQQLLFTARHYHWTTSLFSSHLGWVRIP